MPAHSSIEDACDDACARASQSHRTALSAIGEWGGDGCVVARDPGTPQEIILHGCCAAYWATSSCEKLISPCVAATGVRAFIAFSMTMFLCRALWIRLVFIAAGVQLFFVGWDFMCTCAESERCQRETHAHATPECIDRESGGAVLVGTLYYPKLLFLAV